MLDLSTYFLFQLASIGPAFIQIGSYTSRVDASQPAERRALEIGVDSVNY